MQSVGGTTTHLGGPSPCGRIVVARRFALAVSYTPAVGLVTRTRLAESIAPRAPWCFGVAKLPEPSDCLLRKKISGRFSCRPLRLAQEKKGVGKDVRGLGSRARQVSVSDRALRNSATVVTVL